MHGVEVVDQRFHCLIGCLIGFLFRVFRGESLYFGGDVRAEFTGQVLEFGSFILGVSAELGTAERLFFDLFRHFFGPFVIDAGFGCEELSGAGKVLKVIFFIGLGDSRSESVVKIHNGLSAVLIVLIGLDGDAGERGIALDVVRFPQEAVSGGESALEELEEVDLAAGRCERVEIEIVDMNIAFAVRFGLFRGEKILFVVVLCAFAAVFEHGAHGGVSVDVGVVALHIAGAGVRERELIIDLHESRFHFAGAGSGRAVEDVFFGDVFKALAHEGDFHGVLNIFNFRHGADFFVFQNRGRIHSDAHGIALSTVSGGFHCFVNGIGDFREVVRNDTSVTFDDLL